MINKIFPSIEAALADVRDGSTIMIGRKGDEDVDITIIPGEPREPEKVAVAAGEGSSGGDESAADDAPDESAAD